MQLTAAKTVEETFNSIQDQLQEKKGGSADDRQGFQFYPRSTTVTVAVHGYSPKIFQFYPRSTFEIPESSLLKLKNFQFYPRSTLGTFVNEGVFILTFNSIQDQLKTYIL